MKGLGIAGALFRCAAQDAPSPHKIWGSPPRAITRTRKFFAWRTAPRLPRRQPRKALRPSGEAPFMRDETNRNSDESSPRSVIYRLASTRRRGTIGGGSAEGGTPSISIWPEMAEFRRPSHMGCGKRSEEHTSE